MGSTEHGAVDPLSEVLALREKYEPLGLYFLVHADAAYVIVFYCVQGQKLNPSSRWGGYFKTLTIPDPCASTLRSDSKARTRGFVPALALMEYTERELKYLQYADSVTVDPHKTGV
jgi:glutamate/tyrosine decarboxylase-like PLP-dependent enzyme